MNIVECRTKEEILKYFKKVGKEISEEELNALKQSFKQAEEKTEALTLQQLNKVAGGAGVASRFIEFFRSSRRTGHKGVELYSLACIEDRSSSSRASSSEHSKLVVDTNRSTEETNKDNISQSQASTPFSFTNHSNLTSSDDMRFTSLFAAFAVSGVLGLFTLLDITNSSSK